MLAILLNTYLSLMIKEPTGQLPQSPFNPYATPRTETAEVATADQPFRVHGILVLCGGFLGLLITPILLIATQPVVSSIPPIYFVLAFLEICKGVLAGMGVGILVDSLLQEKFSRLAPGHWFLLLTVASLAGQYGAESWINSEDLQIGTASFGAWYFAEMVINQGLSILLLTPIVLTTAEPLRWKALAWGMLAFSLVVLLQFPMALFDQVMVLDMISMVLMMTAALGGYALAVALFAVVIVEFSVDHPRVKSRDRYHWLGIFGPAGLTFLMIAIGVAFGYA